MRQLAVVFIATRGEDGTCSELVGWGMRIGIPKEIKDQENRVALTPAGARALGEAGHTVIVERGAGMGSGFSDDDYRTAGATLGAAADAWQTELVVKIKEPLESEYGRLGEQILFTYLHLAGAPRALTTALLAGRTTAIAYETVEDAAGRLPLLAPMSAIAGAMAPVVGAHLLARFNGGRGTLLGRVLGRSHGAVTIVGDGVVGQHACAATAGLGAHVTVFGVSAARAATFECHAGVRYALSTPEAIALRLPQTDLLIGAVLRRGARAPHVVTEGMVASMPAGAAIVDVSIDQGGCIATSRATSHTAPTFVAHGVTHYCVPNMPGTYPRTATLALTEATLPYVLRIASGGLEAVASDPGLTKGVNVHAGHIHHRGVAEGLDALDHYVPWPHTPEP